MKISAPFSGTGGVPPAIAVEENIISAKNTILMFDSLPFVFACSVRILEWKSRIPDNIFCGRKISDFIGLINKDQKHFKWTACRGELWHDTP